MSNNRNTGGLSLEDAMQLEDRNLAMCIVQMAAQADWERGK